MVERCNRIGRQVLLGLALALLTVAGTASAQEQTPRAESRAHFEHGVELFEAGSYQQALIEFEAAYEALPNYRLLFNIGNVHAALSNSVEAVAAYEGYLAQGGATLDPDRRAAVEAALETQRRRIGTVLVTSPVDGATVVIDGVDTDRVTPLTAPLRLSIGRYAIGLRLTGYEGPTRSVTVAGASEQTLEIALTRSVEARGSLAITASAPDVQILVDGVPVGMTPLEESEIPVDPGEREVVGRRAGYVVARERVTVREGAVVDVALDLRIDPNAPAEARGVLALALPDAPARLVVDGQEVPMSDGRADVPAGAHDVRVEVDDREPYRFEVEVPAGGEASEAPALDWTATARLDRLDGRNNRRLWGGIVGGAGVIAVGVGASLLIWNVARDNRSELEDSHIQCLPMRLGGAGGECAGQDAIDAARYNDLENTVPLVTGVSVGVLAAGALGAGLGAWLLFGADSDEDIDDAAHAGVTLRVAPGPGSVTLFGTF